jgi:hypothetical protein
MKTMIAAKDNARTPESAPRESFARPARHADAIHYQPPMFIIPQPGLCIYVARHG